MRPATSRARASSARIAVTAASMTLAKSEVESANWIPSGLTMQSWLLRPGRPQRFFRRISLSPRCPHRSMPETGPSSTTSQSQSRRSGHNSPRAKCRSRLCSTSYSDGALPCTQKGDFHLPVPLLRKIKKLSICFTGFLEHRQAAVVGNQSSLKLKRLSNKKIS